MSSFLNRKKAQEFVDKLAYEWNVPPIKVISIPKNQRAPGIGVYYSGAPDWHIGITNRATEDKLKHEFGHYLVDIVRIKLKTEEEIINGWT